eukprot:TRINITY_DN51216_c0_g1_i1.p1 TRINITY_DN51216_c0_g1~~TRINITY_DN51216_c0_g1_i1.p1  ORF type:complete len:898 (+),score=168.00 TRINITY_DN51216_c0_g1_i1:75-2768(+)
MSYRTSLPVPAQQVSERPRILIAGSSLSAPSSSSRPGSFVGAAAPQSDAGFVSPTAAHGCGGSDATFAPALRPGELRRARPSAPAAIIGHSGGVVAISAYASGGWDPAWSSRRSVHGLPTAAVPFSSATPALVPQTPSGASRPSVRAATLQQTSLGGGVCHHASRASLDLIERESSRESYTSGVVATPGMQPSVPVTPCTPELREVFLQGAVTAVGLAPSPTRAFSADAVDRYAALKSEPLGGGVMHDMAVRMIGSGATVGRHPIAPVAAGDSAEQMIGGASPRAVFRVQQPATAVGSGAQGFYPSCSRSQADLQAAVQPEGDDCGKFCSPSIRSRTVRRPSLDTHLAGAVRHPSTPRQDVRPVVVARQVTPREGTRATMPAVVRWSSDSRLRLGGGGAGIRIVSRPALRSKTRDADTPLAHDRGSHATTQQLLQTQQLLKDNSAFDLPALSTPEGTSRSLPSTSAFLAQTAPGPAAGQGAELASGPSVSVSPSSCGSLASDSTQLVSSSAANSSQRSNSARDDDSMAAVGSEASIDGGLNVEGGAVTVLLPRSVEKVVHNAVQEAIGKQTQQLIGTIQQSLQGPALVYQPQPGPATVQQGRGCGASNAAHWAWTSSNGGELAEVSREATTDSCLCLSNDSEKAQGEDAVWLQRAHEELLRSVQAERETRAELESAVVALQKECDLRAQALEAERAARSEEVAKLWEALQVVTSHLDAMDEPPAPSLPPAVATPVGPTVAPPFAAPLAPPPRGLGAEPLQGIWEGDEEHAADVVRDDDVPPASPSSSPRNNNRARSHPKAGHCRRRSEARSVSADSGERLLGFDGEDMDNTARLLSRTQPSGRLAVAPKRRSQDRPHPRAAQPLGPGFSFQDSLSSTNIERPRKPGGHSMPVVRQSL